MYLLKLKIEINPKDIYSRDLEGAIKFLIFYISQMRGYKVISSELNEVNE